MPRTRLAFLVLATVGSATRSNVNPTSADVTGWPSYQEYEGSVSSVITRPSSENDQLL